MKMESAGWILAGTAEHLKEAVDAQRWLMVGCQVRSHRACLLLLLVLARPDLV